MLTKSQARAFFVIGTGLFTIIFLGLTVDTLKQIPHLTKQQNMSPEVIKGKHLFDQYNCMGCHTILGEGAYYAPELTKVYDRRGPVFIDMMLQDPEALFPGERRMPKYPFSKEERDNMIAFFEWIGKVDTNGFPKDPPLGKQFIINPAKFQTEEHASASTQTAAASVSKPAVFDTLCLACHAVGGKGGAIGPALDGTSKTRDAKWLREWLLDPAKIKPGTTMPKLPLSENDLNALVEYLSVL